jgi:hypothetical protein
MTQAARLDLVLPHTFVRFMQSLDMQRRMVYEPGFELVLGSLENAYHITKGSRGVCRAIRKDQIWPWI